MAAEGAETLGQSLKARVGKGALGGFLNHSARTLIPPRSASPEPVEGGLIEALALLPEQLPHLQGLAFTAPFHEELVPGPKGRRPL